MTASERLRARIGRADAEPPLKLRFDRRFVDHRPDLRNSFVAELIENVLSEDDPPAVHRETEKEALRPAVEPESARDMRRVADQKFDGELKVRDRLEIALEHGAVTGEPERPAVVSRVVGDEAVQIRPILPVQAGDVISVVLGESVFGHRATLGSARQNMRDYLRWVRRGSPIPTYVYMHAWEVNRRAVVRSEGQKKAPKRLKELIRRQSRQVRR
jgi:hypothetical protein